MSKVIDMHCHAAQAPEIAKLIEGVVRPENDPSTYYLNDASREHNRKLGRERYAMALTSVDERIASMDRAGVDIQVVSPSPQQFYWAEPELGQQLSRLQNEHVRRFVSANPDRLTGLGSVPLQAPKLAADELAYVMQQPGMKGVQISTYIPGVELGDSVMEPFWEAAERLAAVVFMHPLGFSHGERFREFYLNNAIANPLESTLALASLIFNAVLHRHPDLKLVVAHGGGYLPFHPGRIDHAWEVRPECRLHIDRPPSAYLKQVYADTVVFEPEAVARLVKTLGAGHVVLGTDYPFDMGEEDPVGLLERTPELSPEERAMIAGANAAGLLGIDAG